MPPVILSALRSLVLPPTAHLIAEQHNMSACLTTVVGRSTAKSPSCSVNVRMMPSRRHHEWYVCGLATAAAPLATVWKLPSFNRRNQILRALHAIGPLIAVCYLRVRLVQRPAADC